MQVLAEPAVAFRDALRALPLAVDSPTASSADRQVARGEWALTRAREQVARLTPHVQVARVLAYDELVAALLGALSGARTAVTGARGVDADASLQSVSRKQLLAATRPVVVVPTRADQGCRGRVVVDARDEPTLEGVLRWVDAFALPVNTTLELTYAGCEEPDAQPHEALQEAVCSLDARGFSTVVVSRPRACAEVLTDRAVGADLVVLRGSHACLDIAPHLLSHAACPLAFLPEERP